MRRGRSAGASLTEPALVRRVLADAPKNTRRTGSRLVLLIGCALAAGLIGILVISGRNLLTGSYSTASPPNYRALATSAFETALATRVLASPFATPASPPLTPSDGFTASAPPAGQPANPWVDQIPEAACIQTDLPQTGRVVEVVDGRTIKVLLDGDGRVFAVRYIGLGPLVTTGSQLPVDSPATMNAQLTYHKQATLVRDITDADPSGTLVRYVMVGRVFVNYALIAGGYAVAQSSAPDTACASQFDAAQRQAQAGAIRLWGPPTP